MQKQILKIIFSFAMFLMLPGFAMAGITPVTHLGVNNFGGFPVALTVAGETYQLTENIDCDTTCFTVKASDITVDLNGKTATFGNVNNPDLQNTGMESWIDGSTLSNWTVSNGTISQRAAQVWGSYDAELSATATLKSDTVTLNAGQSYNYYSIIGGTSSDSYVISVRDAIDNTILSSTTISGSQLNRAFAMESGVIGVTENEYKPSVNIDVYLQIDCAGTAVKRLSIADIKPAKHYFLASSNYRNNSNYPDLTDDLFGGFNSGLIIRDGTIAQGAGNAVKSAAVYSSAVANMSNVNIFMSGNNTSAINTSGSFVLDAIMVDTDSILNFNRMHAPTSFALAPAATGTVEIKNCTLLNDPEQAISYSYADLMDTDTHTTLIHHNLIRQKEQVTEGYAMVLSGIGSATIYNNTIDPYRGRGILLDAVTGRTGKLWGTRNVTIRDNVIQNIHEFRTPEYDVASLEAAGIRIRDWGGIDRGHVNLKIYGNNISGFVDSIGTHRTYGINITSQSAVTSADIYNNVINISLNSQLTSDWQASAMVLQGADMSLGGSIDIHNNELTGSHTVRFGGNDGSSVKNIELHENIITGSIAPIFYYGYQGPFSDNSIYCNKFNNTGIAGYPIYFDDGVPTVNNQYFSNNLITNANAGGYEMLLGKNYASSVTSCNNGAMDIFGGGSVGNAADPCHDGAVGCYASAGLLVFDGVAPSAPSGLGVL